MQNFTCRTDIFSGYERNVLVGLLVALVFSINTFSQTNLTEESSDIIIYGDVRLYIDSAEEVTTHGSLTGIDGAVIENQGSLIFDVNTDFQSINNFSSPQFFKGMGNYYFIGDADFNSGGDFENTFHTLWLNKTGNADLYLKSDLGIANRLQFISGKIVTGKDHKVIVRNRDSSAIRVNNFAEMSNETYVFGNLRRYIAGDTNYHFPVGLSNTYFPLRIDNTMQGVDYLDVTFDEDVPLTGKVDFQLGLYNFYALNQTGAWMVKGNAQPTSGNMDIKAFIFDYTEKLQNKLETNMYGLVYHPDPKGYDDMWSLAGEYGLPGGPYRVQGSDSTILMNTIKMGYYTLAVADITKLINFISPGGGRESRFYIPTIDRYETTELIVYNAMGREIFQAKPYNNDLDMQDFKDGTYYYIFKYTRNGTPGVIQSFIDVKRVY